MPEQSPAAHGPDDPDSPVPHGEGADRAERGRADPAERDPADPAERGSADPAERELADEVDAVLRGRVRRAPRYGAFVAVGVVVGLVVGLLVPFAGRGGWDAGVALFLAASGVVVGAVTGAAMAAIVDLRTTR